MKLTGTMEIEPTVEQTERQGRTLDLVWSLQPRPDGIGPDLDPEEGLVVRLVYRYPADDFGGVSEWEKQIADELGDHGLIVKKIEAGGWFMGPEPQPDSRCAAWSMFTVVAQDQRLETGCL